jgi:hypothetical protein
MTKVWIDYQDDSEPSTEVEVEVVPRVGELVGLRQPDGMVGTKTFALDYVVAVLHYLVPTQEIRVMTSSQR